jgi:hypothetical protein
MAQVKTITKHNRLRYSGFQPACWCLAAGCNPVSQLLPRGTQEKHTEGFH